MSFGRLVKQVWKNIYDLEDRLEQTKILIEEKDNK